MKKEILKLGKTLSKVQLKTINGGLARCHFGKFPNTGCPSGFVCSSNHQNGTCKKAL